MPALEVADVFRRHGEAYRRAHADHLGRTERRVMGAIEACRTAALGGHVECCVECGLVRISYNSCRDRHCAGDYRHHDKSKVMALAADEFIRCFLLHTLPDGFHRIRHYGFPSNGHRAEKIARCQELLTFGVAAPSDNADETAQPREGTFDLCPSCGGRMEILSSLPRSRPADHPASHDSS
jgi:Transposase zinc-binding domain/Putative transposase